MIRKFRILFLIIFGLSSIINNAYSSDSQLYFEGWETNHRVSGTNNYGAAPKIYGDFTFVYSDAVNTGSPLTGSYHGLNPNKKKGA